MAANQTTNYQLNQWEPTDAVQRVEFNQDNAKVDAALKSLSDQVVQKADQSAVNTLISAVNQKADASTIGDLAKAVQKLFGNTGTQIIGTRHGEKLYETLMTKEERVRSEDMGGYFRVSADGRDLNYDKFVVQGEVHTQADESYPSHNTRLLTVEETVAKIMTTEYVQTELANWGK